MSTMNQLDPFLLFMMSVKHWCARLLLAVLLVSPLSSFAATLTQIPDTTAAVSRGQFVRWAVDGLRIEKQSFCTLPYRRVNAALKPYLCGAQKKGALSVWGDRATNFNRTITHGEALFILAALTNSTSTENVSSFRDVRRAWQKRAAAVSIERRWIGPSGERSFGINIPLKAREAKALLEAVVDEELPTVQTIKVDVNATDAIPNEQMLKDVWHLLRRDYLKIETLDANEASYQSVEGIINSIQDDDPYAKFYRPDQAENFNATIKGEISGGIGAHVEEKSGEVIVVAPLDGSPAQKAGVLPGDVILKANEQELSGLGLEKAVNYIRGPNGSNVDLLIRRNGGTITIRVQRGIVTIPEVKISWHDNNQIAMVQLLQFGERTDRTIRDTFEEVVQKNPRGIILDLRNNPGGLLHAAVVTVGVFVPKGSDVLQVKSREETSIARTDMDPVVPTSTRLIVLVNKGSASAAEIVAGALQDLKRGTIVGSLTFGKGTVQQIIELDNGSAVKFTVAEWFTPNGRKIDTVGVEPDVKVEDTVDPSGRDDAALQRALLLLR